MIGSKDETYRRGTEAQRKSSAPLLAVKSPRLRGERTRLQVRALFVVSLIWLLPTLACGSFAPRPTPTPTAQVNSALGSAVQEGAQAAVPAATPILAVATETPEAAAPTPTFTPTVVAGTALAVGQPARVAAPGGLNMRQTPSAAGQLVIRLGANQIVNIIEGPTTADNFTWWQLDDGQGNVGWAAAGDDETEWLSPNIGVAQPVDRPPNVGDRVVLSIPLSVRAQPTTSATLLTEASQGAQFTVLAGPQAADGYNWYQIRSDDGAIEGWAADGDGTNRWMSPLE